jgi:calcineurin-like phosphoesterase
VATGGQVALNAVLIDIDDATRRARSIERVDRECLLR